MNTRYRLEVFFNISYNRYASPLYVDMSKRTQIATPHDPNNPNKNPNDLFQDESGSERPPMTKVFIGKVRVIVV